MLATHVGASSESRAVPDWILLMALDRLVRAFGHHSLATALTRCGVCLCHIDFMADEEA